MPVVWLEELNPIYDDIDMMWGLGHQKKKSKLSLSIYLLISVFSYLIKLPTLINVIILIK